MGLDITPGVPPGHKPIQGYGDGGFRIGNVAYQGSLLVFPDRVVSWPMDAPEHISAHSLSEVVDADPRPQLLLVGCGTTFAPPPLELRQSLKDVGIVLEWMDTGAACRTFNVLLGEERSFAAALIAI